MNLIYTSELQSTNVAFKQDVRVIFGGNIS